MRAAVLNRESVGPGGCRALFTHIRHLSPLVLALNGLLFLSLAFVLMLRP